MDSFPWLAKQTNGTVPQSSDVDHRALSVPSLIRQGSASRSVLPDCASGKRRTLRRSGGDILTAQTGEQVSPGFAVQRWRWFKFRRVCRRCHLEYVNGNCRLRGGTGPRHANLDLRSLHNCNISRDYDGQHSTDAPLNKGDRLRVETSWKV